MIHELKNNVEQQGGKFEDYLIHIKKTSEELEQDFKPDAEKRVKTSLMISQVVKEEKVEVPKEELEAKVVESLKSYEGNEEMKKKADTQEFRNYLQYNLLNQKVIAGIGNIYADEICFRAGIRPQRYVNKLSKKEILSIEREKEKLDRVLGGIRDMNGLPSAIFLVDAKKEAIALHEAKRLNIPVFAILDTNADPDLIDYSIPSNDDAFKAINLITHTIADAIIEGKEGRSEFSTMMEGKEVKPGQVQEKEAIVTK